MKSGRGFGGQASPECQFAKDQQEFSGSACGFDPGPQDSRRTLEVAAFFMEFRKCFPGQGRGGRDLSRLLQGGLGPVQVAFREKSRPQDGMGIA